MPFRGPERQSEHREKLPKCALKTTSPPLAHSLLPMVLTRTGHGPPLWFSPSLPEQARKEPASSAPELLPSCFWNPKETRTPTAPHLVAAVPFANLLPRQVHGVPGPVVHQLVQVVREGALAAGGDGRGLARGGLAVHCSPHRVGAAGPCKRKHSHQHLAQRWPAPRALNSCGNGTPGVKMPCRLILSFDSRTHSSGNCKDSYRHFLIFRVFPREVCFARSAASGHPKRGVATAYRCL